MLKVCKEMETVQFKMWTERPKFYFWHARTINPQTKWIDRQLGSLQTYPKGESNTANLYQIDPEIQLGNGTCIDFQAHSLLILLDNTGIGLWRDVLVLQASLHRKGWMDGWMDWGMLTCKFSQVFLLPINYKHLYMRREEDRIGQDRTGQDRTGQDRGINTWMIKFRDKIQWESWFSCMACTGLCRWFRYHAAKTHNK